MSEPKQEVLADPQADGPLAKKSKYAFVSVTNEDKGDKLVSFIKLIIGLGWGVISTGGTAKFLREAGCEVEELEKYSGGGSIFGGRVKSLSRELAMMLLSRDNDEDRAELEAHGLVEIGMVICSFYKLDDAIADPNATIESVTEKIDIGGPTMISEGAKGNRIVVCDLDVDLERVAEELQACGDILDLGHRQYLRAKADLIVARYRMSSARYFSDGDFDGLFMEQACQLAYGENRNQSPAFLFTTDNGDPLATSQFTVESGDPSYISMADGAGLITVMRFLAEAFDRHFSEVPFIAIAGKHGNVCGIGVDWHLPSTALTKALLGDKTAVMGGEVVTNFDINDELGALLMSPDSDIDIGRSNWGLDIIFAPSFSKGSIEQLGKKAKRRLLSNSALINAPMPVDDWMWKVLDNGDVLKQKAPRFVLSRDTIEEWVNEPLDEDHFCDLLIAWAACYFASSNTVALAKDNMLIALGCGQQDRIACVRLCIERACRAGHDTTGSVFASDAFFPYATGEQPEVDLDAMEQMLCAAEKVASDDNRRGMIKILGEMALFISKSDRREGTELLIDAGCIGGIVPADGKNLEQVKALFDETGLSVAFLNKNDRMFSKH